MKKNYIKGMLLLGAVALCGTAANAEWQSLNNIKLMNAAYLPGWSGGLTFTSEGVGECYDGAFNLYQEVHNLPAGEYTLTVNAFYRPATEGAQKAVVYINNVEVPVILLSTEVGNTAEANAAFEAGEYVNTVKCTLPAEGTVKVGIKSYGDRANEWTCFDNFKLVGPNGEVELVNADFAQRLEDNGKNYHDAGVKTDVENDPWDYENIARSKKSPDIARSGGIYGKVNASPYNVGQRVELEAGKYRFTVQGFLRMGGGSSTEDGWWSIKGENTFIQNDLDANIMSALYRHNNGLEDPAHQAYIYVTNGWDTDDDDNMIKPVDALGALDPDYGNPNGFYNEVPFKCIFDEELEVYPDNTPQGEGLTPLGHGYFDSGNNAEAAMVFVNNPDLYINVIEFELTAPEAVWVGIKKDNNAPSQYWHVWHDIRLEQWVEGAGVEGIAVDNSNAPVEYYNLQGMRVNEPTTGIYIVKQGNQVSKKVIR